MLFWLLCACVAVFINAVLTKSGKGMSIVKMACVLMLLAIVAYRYTAATETDFARFKKDFLKQYKYVSNYDQVGVTLFDVEFLRLYNNEDYLAVVRDIDDLLKLFNHGMFDKQKLANFADKRKDIINALHFFASSISPEGVVRLGVATTKLQALTYAMLRKLQRVHKTAVFVSPAPFDASNNHGYIA
jgi:hypothetical protein